MYGINEKLFIVGVAVIFISTVIAGVLIWQVMILWLKNKREQRRWEGKQREQDRVDRLEHERCEYIQTIKEQTDRIRLMVSDMKVLSDNYQKAVNDYEKAKERMSKFNMKGEMINGTVE